MRGPESYQDLQVICRTSCLGKLPDLVNGGVSNLIQKACITLSCISGLQVTLKRWFALLKIPRAKYSGRFPAEAEDEGKKIAGTLQLESVSRWFSLGFHCICVGCPLSLRPSLFFTFMDSSTFTYAMTRLL